MFLHCWISAFKFSKRPGALRCICFFTVGILLLQILHVVDIFFYRCFVDRGFPQTFLALGTGSPVMVCTSDRDITKNVKQFQTIPYFSSSVAPEPLQPCMSMSPMIKQPHTSTYPRSKHMRVSIISSLSWVARKNGSDPFQELPLPAQLLFKPLKIPKWICRPTTLRILTGNKDTTSKHINIKLKCLTWTTCKWIFYQKN